MTDGRQFVFGYGSLVAVQSGRRAVRLHGHRRIWGVAMDNTIDVPGYKTYRLREDGSRPAVFVAFLDLIAEPGAVTQGTLLAVDDAALRVLDERERNYDRIDVTTQIEAAPSGTIWTYRGSDDGRERLRIGRRERTAVIDSAYLEAVETTFTALGLGDELPGDDLPLMSLRRVDLPAP
ncbi:MAG: gamma-glutamylcyclotransferase family protein [Solirubrobacteraceae bacterium]|nr:gamma-glutamylcyclotransferase family protein [Solirubrobacteraceae bacterium]